MVPANESEDDSELLLDAGWRYSVVKNDVEKSLGSAIGDLPAPVEEPEETEINFVNVWEKKEIEKEDVKA